MPTIAISETISESVYTIAVLLLAGLLAGPVYLLYGASQTRGAQLVSAGVAEAVNSLVPGATVRLSIEGHMAASPLVTLSGHEVTASFGSASAHSQVKWSLPRAELVPGAAYAVTLEGQTVVVRELAASG